MVSTSSLKNLQKTEKYHFQTLRTFVFELNVASKQKTIFSSLLKGCKKTWNIPFLNTQNIRLIELKVASKPFSKMLPMTKFWFKQFWTLYFFFPENGFNFVSQLTKKQEIKNAIFRRL